jgi:DNA-binding response OmpR family regulator
MYSMNQTSHILMIEDDPAVASSLKEGLERESYTVTWKENGHDGIEYARDHSPHLIILDVRLPDMSGFDVCRQMRQMKLRQPIIMLTAKREEIDKVLGLEMGADDYVTKPFSLQELRSRVRAQLRRAYGELSVAESDIIHTADLVIDRTGGQVWRGEQLLNLTPTEFRLLTLFAQHPGQALSRRQILDAVWGYSADVESERTVNVHIRRLREKIEPDASQPMLILTIPGIGYRYDG